MGRKQTNRTYRIIYLVKLINFAESRYLCLAMGIKKTYLIPLLALCIASAGFTQKAAAQDYYIHKGQELMEYKIIGKDTVLVDDITPAVIHPSKVMSKRDLKEYYRRLHNFSKAYPYALLISKIINETDSILAASHFTKKQKNRYLDNMKKQLLKDFEPAFRKLTLKQGLMMIRLIDREVGLTPYYIVKRYLGGPSAGFWQGIAKIFKGNLKQPYDRFGQDKDLEEFVVKWQNGEFDDYYEWVFGKPRPEIFIPERYR